jgi:hypothetical protein
MTFDITGNLNAYREDGPPELKDLPGGHQQHQGREARLGVGTAVPRSARSFIRAHCGTGLRPLGPLV